MAGCGDSDKLPSVGGSCVLNSDCSNPLSCKFGKCHKQCNADRDCDLSQRCVKVDGKGICQLPEEKNCGPSTACLAPLACSSDNQCRTGCTTTADCLGTQTCVVGTASGASVCAEPTDRPGAALDGGAIGMDSGTGGGSTDGGLGAPDAPSASSDVGGGFDGNTGAGIDAKPDANNVTLDAQPGVLLDGNTIVSDTRPDAPRAPDATGAGGSGGNGGAGGVGGVGGDGGLPPDVASNPPDSGSYVPPAGPLAVVVTAAADPVAPKGRLRYQIHVGNLSTIAINDVKVLLRIPVGTQFGAAADAEPAASCSDNGYCRANAEATWSFASIGAGERRTVTVNVNVLETVGDGDSISAATSVTATGLSAINATKVVKVFSRAASRLVLGTTTDPVTPGQTFTYDLDLGQLGATALANTELKLLVPGGVTVGTISDGGTLTAAREITWKIGGVAVGASHNRKVTVTAENTVPAGALLFARATLAYDGGDPIDMAAEHGVAVAAAALPLKLNVAAAASPASADGRVLYNMTVANESARAIEGVTLSFRIPPGEQMSSAQDAEPNAACSDNGYCRSNASASWTLGTIPAGTTKTVTVNAAVVATLVGDGDLMPVYLCAGATGMDSVYAVKTVPVWGASGAQLALGTVKDPLIPGETFTYDLDVGQIGSTALTNTQLRALLPAGVTVGTISDGGSQAPSGEIVWNLGTVGVGSAVRRQVDVTVQAGLAPARVLHATAVLTYDGGAEVDAVAEHAVSVEAQAAPLKIEVTAAPNPVAPGSRLLYTATVTNLNARAIDGVHVVFREPAGTQFSAASDADPDASCSDNGYCRALAEAAWNLGSIAAGMNKVITLNDEILNTVLEGTLLSTGWRVTATGVNETLNVRTTVPTHK